ncbi:MAG TPA: hypothetical protein VN363_10135 [Anaerolineales bacterium]|nr:hypothetical protein [Anaerolineales bacterium]
MRTPYPQSQSLTAESFVSYEIDSTAGLGILTLNQCIFNEVYTDTLCAFFQEVKDQGIQNIAVDLRRNGSGNSKVVNEFLRYLDVDQAAISGGANIRFGPYLYQTSSEGEPNERIPELTYTGKIYVLTAVQTSAQPPILPPPSPIIAWASSSVRLPAICPLPMAMCSDSNPTCRAGIQSLP